MTVPLAVSRHLRELMIAEVRPCLLRIAPDYRLIDLTGEPGHYGLAGLAPGADARERLPLLYGITLDADPDGPPGSPLGWPMVELAEGVFADVLIRPVAGGAAQVLLTDASREHLRRQAAQQHANEMALLNRGLRRTLDELESTRAELEEKNRALEDLNRTLDDLNRAKSRFIANLSHELRTPLTAIVGHARLLRERLGGAPSAGPAGDPQGLWGPGRLAESLRAIESGSDHLMSMVNNVLDQASLETGQLVMNPAPADLGALLADLCAWLRPLAEQRGLVFRLAIQGPLPHWVESDGTRLRQVLVNLATNAIKYTQRGFVELSARWDQGRLGLGVADSGPGIPECDRPRLMQPFQRGTSARGQSGVGLGLAIGAQIVRLLGGELKLRDRPGGGSVFDFEIPAPALTGPHAGGGLTGRPQAGAAPLILLVDDAREIRLVYTSLLQSAGYRARAVASPAEALAELAAERPAAILVDQQLGEEDGALLIRRLREYGYTGPIVAWSASSMRDDRSRPLEAGADRFLVKPVLPEVLEETLRELL
jgi:signal transduction histidine kinase